MTWCVEPPEDCICKWRNTSDHGGWDLVSLNPECPEHGWGDDPPEYDPDDAEAQRIAEACADANTEHDRIENEEAGR